MRNSAFLILFLSFYGLFAVNSVDSIFSKSNDLYNANDFNQALNGYLSIVDKGINNDVLYYNIGNCYYRLKKLGYARLYYEKAKINNPRDRDISHNIEVLKTKLIDDINQIPDFFLVRIIKKINSMFSPSQWGYSLILILYLNLFLILFLFFSNVTEFRVNALRFLLFLVPLFILVLFFLFYSNFGQKYNSAVLVESNTYVKTAPSNSSDDYFIIHEGVKFQLIDEVDNWSRILLSDGKDGWVKKTDFEIIK